MMPLELDLESSPKSMSGYFQEYELIEHRTNNETITNNDIMTIVIKNSSDYTNLSEAYLQVQFKVVKAADGSSYTQAERVSLANGIGCLFSRMTVRINGQVSEVVERGDLAQHMRGLVLYSQDYSQNASNALWYKNTGNGTSVAATDNAGFDSRFARTGSDANNNAVETTAYINLSELCGIASVDKLLVNQEISLEFTRSSSSEHIFNGGVALAKVALTRMSVWSPRIVLEPSADLVIKKSISGGVSSPFMFHNWSSYVSPTLTGNQGTYRVISTSEEVDYVYVAVRNLPDADQVIDANNNPQAYLNGWSSCEVSLNGRRYPLTRYSNLGDAQGRTGLPRAFNQLVKSAHDKVDYSNGCNLTFDEFSANQTLLAFDLTAKAFNWSKSNSTIEVHYDLEAGNGKQLVVCLVSKKQIMVNYQGGQAVVSQA
jgi:hypothetical protein